MKTHSNRTSMDATAVGQIALALGGQARRRAGESRFFAVLFAVLLGLNALQAGAQTMSDTMTNDASAEADKAWKAVVKATQPPFPPAEWQQKEVSPEEQAAFFVPLLLKGADAAKDFYTRYPNHPKAEEARKKERNLVDIAVQKFGAKNLVVRLDALNVERMKDAGASEDERKRIGQDRLAARMAELSKLFRELPGSYDELEKAARATMKEFPNEADPPQLFLAAAQQIGADKAKAVAQEIADSATAEPIKQMARGILSQLDALGKPLDIKFTAIDGREVDLSQMKNKVVLVDFWATWCGPCVGEIPHVKETYEQLHPKGFEIVGISFDQSKDALEKFVAREQMEWPQYFDGKVWSNKYGVQYGIRGIPSMWLVDKKGNLRDMEGRAGLADKVAKLLAE